MNEIVIIVSHDGKFEKILSDAEIDCKILKRGQDDSQIDLAEATLEEIAE